MDFPKPDCYDSVPPCLCKKCQSFDVYMASCVPRTFAQTTSGLSVVNAARSSFANVHSRSVRRKPARSRPVAPPVTSSSRPVASPVTSKSVVASSRLVAPPVSSCAPFGSRARTCTVAASSVAARPVAASSVSSPISVPAVVSSPSSVGMSSSVVVSSARSSPVGSLACPVTVSPVRPSPVVVPSVKFGPAGPGSTVPRFVSPRVPLAVGSLPGRPFCSPFIPVVCFVLAVVPVLLFSPFGLVWSFLPVWR